VDGTPLTLNSDIFHQSIKNAIDVYEKHPEFDDGTIISDNRVEFVLTAINSNTSLTWKADVLLPILDDDNIPNIFAQKR
jgi:hypothetical protein